MSESQLPSQLRAPTSSAATATHGARGVERRKTRAKLALESQERYRQEDNSRRAAQRAAVKVRKDTERMEPRKDNIL